MTSPLDFCMFCGSKPTRKNGDFCSNACYVVAREAIHDWKKQQVDEHDVPEAMEMQKEMNKGKELK